jgi:hypothetical protein
MTFQRKIKLSLALVSGMLLGGCVTPKMEPVQPPPPVVTKTVNVYPQRPGDDALTCLPDVKAPDALLDGELFDWGESERVAGSDCRDKLEALRKWILGWPK